MNKVNYQKELEKIIVSLKEPKKVFLHSCCAPCSSYVLEYLTNYFDITILFYNPNITSKEEYDKQMREIVFEKLIEFKDKNVDTLICGCTHFGYLIEYFKEVHRRTRAIEICSICTIISKRSRILYRNSI